MLQYHYDHQGYYLGRSKAQKDPLAEAAGIVPAYLVAGNSTLLAPPVAKDGTEAVFSDGKWGLVLSRESLKKEAAEHREKLDAVNDKGVPLFEKVGDAVLPRSAKKISEETARVNESLMRSKRDRLLQASDWSMLSDAPIKNKEKWIAYRQALRDLTLTGEVEFPEAPR